MDAVSHSLLMAQRKAEALFAAVVERGMIRPGLSESELSLHIHELANAEFGLRRMWHKRIARSGPNTLLTFYDEPPDRVITEDDIVYLDFGLVFEEWDADLGRTYAVGSDPHKHRLIADIGWAFRQGQRLYQDTPDLTAGALYDFVAGLATSKGWEFGAATAGHLVGRFPHERPQKQPRRFSIRHGNETCIRELDDRGEPRHWILEVHFIDRERQIGGFYEELLTVDGRSSTND
jgi:Xaa-Pro aminopeptidase